MRTDKKGCEVVSTRVVKMSGCQCQSRNSPGFDPSVLRYSGIWGAADEAVLNNANNKRKLKPKKSPFWSSSNWCKRLINMTLTTQAKTAEKREEFTGRKTSHRTFPKRPQWQRQFYKTGNGQGRYRSFVHLSIRQAQASHLGAAVMSSLSRCERVKERMLSLRPCFCNASLLLADGLSVSANGKSLFFEDLLWLVSWWCLVSGGGGEELSKILVCSKTKWLITRMRQRRSQHQLLQKHSVTKNSLQKTTVEKR